MRVVEVTSFPGDPTAPHGGVEAVSVSLVRALAKRDDLDVHVVTVDPTCEAPSVTPWEGAAIHRLPWAGGKVLANAIGPGRRQIQAYLAPLVPDVVHAHDTYGIMVKGMRVPRVFTVHGFIYADTLIAGGRFAWVRSRLWRRVEESSWAEQPHIVSISPYVRERLTGIATGVIHDVENPVNPEFFQVQRNESKGTVFTAAAIGRPKNTLGLVEAFSRVVAAGIKAELRCAGPERDAEYADCVRRYVETRGLAKHVVFLGQISANRVREELRRASVFALPSYQENAPMAVAEAMAVGVPVLTSNRCGMPYMVRDGESGYLVDPNDPVDIAWRLRQLLEDDSLRGRMGETARRIAEERFHPDRVAWRTREVYFRATRNHHPSC